MGLFYLIALFMPLVLVVKESAAYFSGMQVSYSRAIKASLLGFFFFCIATTLWGSLFVWAGGSARLNITESAIIFGSCVLAYALGFYRVLALNLLSSTIVAVVSIVFSVGYSMVFAKIMRYVAV